MDKLKDKVDIKKSYDWLDVKIAEQRKIQGDYVMDLIINACEAEIFFDLDELENSI